MSLSTLTWLLLFFLYYLWLVFPRNNQFYSHSKNPTFFLLSSLIFLCFLIFKFWPLCSISLSHFLCIYFTVSFITFWDEYFINIFFCYIHKRLCIFLYISIRALLNWANFGICYNLQIFFSAIMDQNCFPCIKYRPKIEVTAKKRTHISEQVQL